MGRFDCGIVGIDLGTTNTAIAYYDEILKKGVCCSNGEGSLVTASAVTFLSRDEVLIGNTARNNAIISPEKTAILFKRQMGVKNEVMQVGDNFYSPQQLSALVLRNVVEDAEEELEKAITDVVITVPAYFGVNRRKATIEAGEIAGLNVMGILDEPSAVVYYTDSIKSLDGNTCLVFDLGGGTLDIVVVQVTKNSINEKVIDGDLSLGGNDWDVELLGYIREKYFKGKHLDKDTEQELMIKIEMAKKHLSEKTEIKFGVSNRKGRIDVTLTRQEFDKCTRHLREEVRNVLCRVQRKMKEKNLDKLDMIILAGGATRMPQIRELLEEMFPGKKISAKDVDCAVANGAAIYAKMLWTKEKTRTCYQIDCSGIKKLNNIAGRSYGIAAYSHETGEKGIRNIIFQNSELPAVNEYIFKTKIKNQKKARLEIFESNEDSDRVDFLNAVKIGECILNINNDLPEGSPVHVLFELDENGLLYIKGYEQSGETEIETWIQTGGILKKKTFKLTESEMPIC